STSYPCLHGDRMRTGTIRIAALLGLVLAAGLGLLGGARAEQAPRAPVVGALPASLPLHGGPDLGPNFAGKVERHVLDDTTRGKTTQFVALMVEQADLSKAYGMRDQDARGWYV